MNFIISVFIIIALVISKTRSQPPMICADISDVVFPIQQNSVCENENLEIKCLPDREIVIDYASYGSNEKNICNGFIESDCSARDSFNYVCDICNFKNNCVVNASSQVFGDPCSEKRKFLKIKWRCIPKDKIIDYESTVCVGEEFKVKCPQDRVLIISYANFGAVEKFNQQKVCNYYQSNININPESTEIMKRYCERRNRCIFKVDYDKFNVVYPPNFSYLYIQFKCIPHQTCDNLI